MRDAGCGLTVAPRTPRRWPRACSAWPRWVRTSAPPSLALPRTAPCAYPKLAARFIEALR